MTGRLRVILPPTSALVGFLAGDLALHSSYLAARWQGLPPGAGLDRQAAFLVLCAAAAYGVFRVVAFHPFYRADYRAWLERTPWTSAKPLPVGPVGLVAEDAVVLGGLVLLASVQPDLDPARVLTVCLFALSTALAVTFWGTGAGAFGYVVAFGLGGVVLLHGDRWACLGASAATYAIARAGLRRSLGRFPWGLGWQNGLFSMTTDKYFEQWLGPSCGWPYDQLRPGAGSPLRVDRRDAVLVSLLAGWWLFAVGSLLKNPKDRLGLSTFVVVMTVSLLAVVRFLIYRQGCAPPVSFWGRVVTLRWVIPGYDQVYVGPACTVAVAALAVSAARSWGLAMEVALPATLSLATLVALTARPSLPRWRLTGRHNLYFPLTNQQKQQFVKVG